MGQLIGRAFNMYINNLVPLLLISTALSGLEIMFELTFKLDTSNQLYAVFHSVISLIFSLTITAIASGLIIEIVSKKYLNEHTKFSEYLKNTLPRLLPLIILSLLVGLLTGVGMVVFVIPGIIISLGLALTNQVFIIERKSISGSLSRSWELTKGFRGYIFGVSLILGLIIIPISFGYLYLIYPMIVRSINNPGQINFIAVLGNNIIAALYRPFSACATILIYYNIRISKEGFDVEHLAKHFSSVDNADEA
jgi:hypothetical protein